MEQPHISEQALKHEMMSKLRVNTGDAIWDFIINYGIGLIAMGLVPLFIKKLETSSNVLTDGFTVIYNWISAQVRYYRNRHQVHLFEKVAIIESLTKEKNVNELYKAVYWYLTTTSDLAKETPVTFSYDHRIALDSQNELQNNKVNKMMSFGHEKMFMYDGKEVFYKIESTLVKVYTDKERQREVQVLTLRTQLSKSSSVDFFEEFNKFCLREYAKSLNDKPWVQKIYTNKGNVWTETIAKCKRRFETVILRQDVQDSFLTDFSLFLDSEQWYIDRDIPYTRRYLLVGKPGTGKTSLAKTIPTFRSMKRHIHYLILSEVMSDTELNELMAPIKWDETVLLIEDIDAASKVVRNREIDESLTSSTDSIQLNQQSLEFVSNHSKYVPLNDSIQNKSAPKISTLTPSGLYNCLDGVFSCHGQISFMTTNHPEHLDPALKRPGRTDMIIEFQYCDRDQISRLYYNFFGILPDSQLLNQIEENVFSPASISGLFLKNRLHPIKALEILASGTFPHSP